MCGAGLTLLARADLSSWPSLGPLLSATTGAGALLFTAGLALFAGIQRAIPRAMTKFCEDALAADMHDIATHYRAPAAFFVAALPRSASPGKYGAADDSEEVVGYVGLEYLPEKDPHTAEVRRMIVSAAHRRHGIGERLMRALIAHAEAIPGLRSIELGTSEYQPGAQRLYERLGWTLFHAERVWEGPVNVVIRHFRRPVGGA
ncbi:acyl-CoA N-acyltransferase [Mycena latifolia]|nr:acyl-CoA N-acyltransferase [Mycena latifolia]